MRIAALVVLVLAVAGCGGDATALDPVAEAAETTSAIGSQHVEFVGTSKVEKQVTRLNGSGDFRNDPQLGRMTIRFSDGNVSGRITEVMKGWRVYMKSPLFAGQIPQGKSWLSVDLAKAGRQAGIDFSNFAAQTPGQTLDQLQASGDVKKLGTATIEGVPTTHYTAVLDPAKMPEGAKVQRIATANYAPVHVWVDDEGRVKRMRTAFSTLDSVNVITMTFSRYGEPVDVDIPSDDEAQDMTPLAANQMENGGG
jgi:LppX_LprAFG lipoprotein